MTYRYSRHIQHLPYIGSKVVTILTAFYLFIFLCLSPPFGTVKTFPSPTLRMCFLIENQINLVYELKIKKLPVILKIFGKTESKKKLEFSRKTSFLQNRFSYFIISKIHKNINLQHSIHKCVKCILYY